MKVIYYLRLASFLAAFSALVAFASLAQTVTWQSLGGPRGVYSTLASGQDKYGHIFVSTFSPTSVYRSSDDGVTWEQTDLANQEVYGFAAKDSGLIFAAAYYGIYKSMDNGMHWQLLNDSINSNLSIHITRHGIIYVGTWYQGLAKSTDDGVTWSSAGLIGQPIVSIHSDSSGILFIVTSESGGYRSTNNGSTWMKIDTLKYAAYSFLVDSNNRIYASDLVNLYISIDQGASWREVNSLTNGSTQFYLLASQGDSLYGADNSHILLSTNGGISWKALKWFPYFMDVASLVVTQDFALIANFSQGGVFRSSDRGQSWRSVGNGMGFLPVTSVCCDTSGIVFAGAYQGAFIKKDANNGWQNAVGVDSLPSPFVITSLLATTDGRVYAGGYAAICSTRDQGVNWTYDAIGSITAVGLSASNAVFAANSWETIMPSNSYSDIYRLPNGGRTWNMVYTASLAAIKGFELSARGNMFANADFGIIKSTDDGITWDTLSFNSDPTRSRITAVGQLVASPIGYILCISSDSVFVSLDEGMSWKSACMLKGVNALAASSSGTIYAGTQDQGVLVSSDTGATWVQSNTGLTNLNVSSLSVASDGTLLCGTASGGVFRSLEVVVGVPKTSSASVTDFRLVQNYPDPFNPSTTIGYSLPSQSYVRLQIYNVLGQLVITLYKGEQSQGYHTVVWNANVSTGIYYYRIEATVITDPSRHFVDTKKMVLIR